MKRNLIFLCFAILNLNSLAAQQPQRKLSNERYFKTLNVYISNRAKVTPKNNFPHTNLICLDVPNIMRLKRH